MKHEERRGKPFKGPQHPSWPLVKLAYVVISLPLLGLYRVKELGLENVPEGACILAGNHVSYLDPAVMWSLMPKGPLHFVAKSELYRHKFLGWALDNLGALPVERDAADRKMIAQATALLKAGERIAIFPEGTRGRERDDFEELGQAQQGAAFLAMHAGVPIVPVGIAGTDKVIPPGKKLPRFPRIAVKYGKPLSIDSFEGSRKEKLEALTNAVMHEIFKLRDEAREAIAHGKE